MPPTLRATLGLPPLPTTPSKRGGGSGRTGSYDQQATIRHGNNTAVAREPSDEDDYEGAYGAPNHRGDVDDELPDTTMLDSVVLPAIASVSPFSRAGGVRVGSGFC